MVVTQFGSLSMQNRHLVWGAVDDTLKHVISPISQVVRLSIGFIPGHVLVSLGKRSPDGSRRRDNLNSMLTFMLLIAWFLIAAAQVVLAQNCSSEEQCPERAPCCSEYGWCGTGQAFCLGGCEPFGECRAFLDSRRLSSSIMSF
jgi:hypothetical protein